MNLPVITNTNVSKQLNDSSLIFETAKQIMKDFAMFGIEITYSGNSANAYNELHQQLVNQITTLLSSNYSRLLSVLYQVDISNREIEKTTAEMPHYNEVEVIAHQIIVRDYKKVLTRLYFKNV